MSLSIDVVKRASKRPTEKFDPEKLHKSIIAVCSSVRTPEGEAEDIAKAVIKEVIKWLEKRPEVTSGDIRNVTARHLKKYHTEASYLYEQHKITI
ncbi:MAG TPA: hypothetical protein PLO25_01340 [Candidatus Saccharibacteria bacterium]|nr:hypothetical protein [Candidatus Saccharibacteria bacterium]